MSPPRALAACLACLAFSISSRAAGQTLFGRVREKETGKPLARVEVQLLPDSGAPLSMAPRTATDTDGTFYLDAPGPGTYRVAFAAGTVSLRSTPLRLAKDEVLQREYLLELKEPQRDYMEFEVDKPVRELPRMHQPTYPESMRRAGVEGEVLAQFVVDTIGRPDLNTLKILRSTYRDFTESVRRAIPELRFEPARLNGYKVRQLVQLPFEFCFRGHGPLPGQIPDTGQFWSLRHQQPAACR